MLLPEDPTGQVAPLGNRLGFLNSLCDSYYAYSSCVIYNMCGFENGMTDCKKSAAFPDEADSYESSFFEQFVATSPVPQEHPSRSPSLSSDSGRPGSAKPQYTAELDVLCRICGDRASGFHYGVHSCEGCKGFFRRTLKKQLTYRPCQVGSRCKIDQASRNKCQYCRYQRCINAGMSQDAVRFGRMPKAEREKLMADKEELSTTDGKRIVELRSLTDLIKAAFRDVFQDTIFFKNACQQNMNTSQEFPKVESVQSPFEDVQEFTSADFFTHEIFKLYQEAIVPVMEAGVKFAKKLPNFSSLAMSDQICLMKTNGFLIVPISLLFIIDKKNITFGSHKSRLCLCRTIPVLCDEIKTLLERTIHIADKLASFKLQIGELALFSSVVLTQECYGLSNPHQVEELQVNLIEALRLDLKHNHPKERLLLPKLLVLIADLCHIMEEFNKSLSAGLFDPSPDFHNVQPLLKEIFDLC